MAISKESNRVVVVGAGIVGLSVALRLALDGVPVCVLDRNAPMQGCSYGNAGYLTQSNIFPPLSRGVLKKLPRFLLDPNSPLVVRLSYLKAFTAWGWRAARELSSGRSRTVHADLSLLNRRAIDDFAPLLEASGARDLISREGSLVVFRSPGALHGIAQSIDVWRSNGVAAEVVDGETVREMEPGLVRDLAGAVHFPNSGRCLNPEALGLRYADALAGLGMEILRDEVRGIRNAHEGVLVETANGAMPARNVVVCAGYSSKKLLKQFGLDLPLASERGYHYMLPTPGVALNRPIVFGESYFAATPMQNGLRLAGTAEFSWPEARPDMGRAKHLYETAARYIPGLNAMGATSWMGVRPSLPDGKPAIGQVKGAPDVFYAFGHGHSGLTYSAATARYVRDLMFGGADAGKKAPFSIERFSV